MTSNQNKCQMAYIETSEVSLTNGCDIVKVQNLKHPEIVKKSKISGFKIRI